MNKYHFFIDSSWNCKNELYQSLLTNRYFSITMYKVFGIFIKSSSTGYLTINLSFDIYEFNFCAFWRWKNRVTFYPRLAWELFGTKVYWETIEQIQITFAHSALAYSLFTWIANKHGHKIERFHNVKSHVLVLGLNKAPEPYITYCGK